MPHLWYHAIQYGFAATMIGLLILSFAFNYNILISGLQSYVFLAVLWIIFTIIGGPIKQKLEKDM